MYCKYCGHKISEDTNFCPNCGKRIAEGSAEKAQYISRKVFHFGVLATNKSAVSKVNQWLSQQSIIFQDVHIMAAMKQVPLIEETVPTRIEIKYIEAPDAPICRMGFFKQTAWLSTNTEKLERKLEDWKAKNSQYHCIGSVLCANHRADSHTASLYFFYC